MWFEQGLVRGTWRFALAVTALHFLLLLPALLRHHGDFSVFVVAGDRFVDRAAPVLVRPHSDGYDGQFYYRLALAPFDTAARAGGVALDHPAWRAQRIFYPLVARAAALGQARLVPASLFGVNLAGIFALAALAWHAAARLGAPRAMAFAVALWPGWLVALSHDTTEILAASLLLGALLSWAAERYAAYALLMALAALTRESAILLAGGMVLAALVSLARRPRGGEAWRRAAFSILALAPFLAWRQWVTLLWRDVPQAHGVAENIGWPLAGYGATLAASLLNRAVAGAAKPHTAALRGLTLLALAWLGWFGAKIAVVLTRLLARGTELGLALGVALLLGLMSLLTARGPWVEPTAVFRAFSEFWVAGWLLLAAGGRVKLRGWVLALAAAPVVFLNWRLCLIQLG